MTEMLKWQSTEPQLNFLWCIEIHPKKKYQCKSYGKILEGGERKVGSHYHEEFSTQKTKICKAEIPDLLKEEVAVAMSKTKKAEVSLFFNLFQA
jgi:hypothetical protein